MIVLGIHGGVTLNQHEPSAAISIDGRIVAHCEEERYLRIKSCYGLLPSSCIKAALAIAGISIQDVDLVVSPGCTYDQFEDRLRLHIESLFGHCPKIQRVHHQEAHIANTFYGSGAKQALALSLDASGDGKSGLIARCSLNSGIEPLSWIERDNSLGFFYSLITSYLGFGDGDEYKVMGLASYGTPNVDLSKLFTTSSSGWHLESQYLRHDPDPRSPFETKFAKEIEDALRIKARASSEPVTEVHQNIAASAQELTEEALIRFVTHYTKQNPEIDTLCLSGGVALNCVANGKLAARSVVSNIYIPSTPSDRGLSIGCAYLGSVRLGDKPKPIDSAYLGHAHSNEEIESELTANGVAFEKVDDPCLRAASSLANGEIIGWFQGRSESGARALGNRSILANPGSASMQDRVNARIKYREKFRPFAPSVLSHRADLYFDTLGQKSSYMSFAVPATDLGSEKCPATVHIDKTARLQTVSEDDNPTYHSLISNFSDQTGCHAVLNTSFNLKGQPIVESPRDAIMTFFGCGLDELYLGPYLVKKHR